MTNVLARIGAYKRGEIAAAKRQRPLARLESEAKAAAAPAQSPMPGPAATPTAGGR